MDLNTDSGVPQIYEKRTFIWALYTAINKMRYFQTSFDQKLEGIIKNYRKSLYAYVRSKHDQVGPI